MIHIIPAIDLIDGKCVRLSQGDFNRKTNYDGLPVDLAMRYQDAGMNRLHLVDLDGARQKKVINLKTLEQIAKNTKLHIDFGGGLQSDQDVKDVFSAGASQITGGSIAVRNPEVFEQWINKYGSEKIILGADAKDEKIAIGGWMESTDVCLYEFIKNYQLKGLVYLLSTDITRDGMMLGPAYQMYEKIAIHTPSMRIIASGGVSCLDDIIKLNDLNIWGVVVGKAFLEGKISLDQIKNLIVAT